MSKSNAEVIEIKTNLANVDKRLSVLESDLKNLAPKLISVESDIKHLIEIVKEHVKNETVSLDKFDKRIEKTENEQTKMGKRIESFGVKIGGILTASTIFITWAIGKIK
jgi:chromosome segregation ATPase